MLCYYRLTDLSNCVTAANLDRGITATDTEKITNLSDDENIDTHPESANGMKLTYN